MLSKVNRFSWLFVSALLVCLIYSNYSLFKKTAEISNAIEKDSNEGRISWLNEKEPTVIALGSSVTEGNGASSLDKSWVGLLNSYLLKSNPNTTVINLGIGGYTTEDVIRNTTKIVTNMEPDLVIFENCLINDFKKGFTTSRSEENIEKTYVTMKKKFPNLRVVIMPPNNMTLGKTINSEGLTYEQYVKKVGEFIQLKGWEYFDFWDVYNENLEKQGLSFTQSISADQTHPNNLGYSTWFSVIKDYFNKN